MNPGHNHHQAASACSPEEAHAEEYRLLLACLRRALNSGEPGNPSVTPSLNIGWPRFLALAQHHEILPLLITGLKDFESSVPPFVNDWLAGRCKTIVARNLSLASELLALLECFRISEIPAVPFKGPALAVALYGSLSLRQIGDLDIFVDRRHMGRAVQVLQEHGYALDQRFLGVPDEELYFWHKDLEFTHPDTEVHVELHWSACEPSFDGRLSSMTLWNAGSSTILLGTEVPMPAREDLLLLLSLHGLRHRWECLKWISDVAVLVRASPCLDWDALLDKAGRLARKRMVLLALTLARELFETPLPSSVSDSIARDSTLSELAKRIRAGHDGAGDTAVRALSPEAVLSRTHFDFLRIQTRDRLSDRLSLFARLLIDRVSPNREDKRYLPLPHILGFLYWLIRPFRLCRMYGALCMLQLTRRLFGALYGSG